MSNTTIKAIFLMIFSVTIVSCSKQHVNKTESPKAGTLEVIAELGINPGNVAATKSGRIFATIHPLRPQDIQLIEITGKTTYKPFPNAEYQSKINSKNNHTFDTPLGLVIDKKNRLWVVDSGLNIGITRVFSFDIETGKELMRFNIPKALAPKDSFVQDIAIDETNDWVYLADFGNPGIIAINIEEKTFRKISDLNSMQAQDIDIVIKKKVVHFNGNPARIGLNPITLSTDNETLYFGSMNGKKWYSIATNLFRGQLANDTIIKAIKLVGRKPISDGAATDIAGNHYFTNIQNNSIDVLTTKGILKTIVKDERIEWPDSVRFGSESCLYIATNQLHKSPLFNNGKEYATLPYYIFRVSIGENYTTERMTQGTNLKNCYSKQH